jgi:hypothetical protein
VSEGLVWAEFGKVGKEDIGYPRVLLVWTEGGIRGGIIIEVIR